MYCVIACTCMYLGDRLISLQTHNKCAVLVLVSTTSHPRKCRVCKAWENVVIIKVCKPIWLMNFIRWRHYWADVFFAKHGGVCTTNHLYVHYTFVRVCKLIRRPRAVDLAEDIETRDGCFIAAWLPSLFLLPLPSLAPRCIIDLTSWRDSMVLSLILHRSL